MTVIYGNADCSALYHSLQNIQRTSTTLLHSGRLSRFQRFLYTDWWADSSIPKPASLSTHVQRRVCYRYYTRWSDFLVPRSWEIRNLEAVGEQFPLDLCHAMTCHRAQGQTLTYCSTGTIIRWPCFGQIRMVNSQWHQLLSSHNGAYQHSGMLVQYSRERVYLSSTYFWFRRVLLVLTTFIGSWDIVWRCSSLWNKIYTQDSIRL